MIKHKRKNPRKKHRDPSIKDHKKDFVEEAKEEILQEKNIITNSINKAMDTKEKTEESKESSADDKECDKLRKNNKTLIAIVILLGGIAGGSFFIDIAQLFSQKGFSARAIEDAQVVEYNGNTWVRYDDPKITVDVFDADDCKDCVTDEVLVRLRSLIPTLEAHRIDVRTDEGRQYASDNDIKHIPAFLFTDTIIESDFYQGAAILFKDAPNNTYYFEATNVGVPIGEYLEAPSTEMGVIVGNNDAETSIIVFTDFTCTMCKTVDPIIAKIQEEFKDNIKVVVKVTPDVQQKNSMKLAMAAQCANEQEIFDKYRALLFTNQKTLIESDDVNATLIKYATNLKLDVETFEKCLEADVQKELIENNITEASRFGVTGSPTLFINGQPHVGVITYENLKTQIESILNPEENIEE